MTIKAFISYKHQDAKRNDWVEKLYKDLRSAGIDAKLDKYEVAPGESFSDYMTRGIRDCDYVLFIVSPKAVRAVESGNGALAFEMQISNARRLTTKDGFNIIPIFREGKATSTYLSDHRYIDFRNDTDYDENLATLIQWLYREIKPPPLGFKVSAATEEHIARLLANTGFSTSKHFVNDVTPLIPFWQIESWLANDDLKLGLQNLILSKAKDMVSEHNILSLSINSFAFLHSMSPNINSLNSSILPYIATKLIWPNIFSDKPLLVFDFFLNTGANVRRAISEVRKYSDCKIDLLVVLRNDIPQIIRVEQEFESKNLGINQFLPLFTVSNIIQYLDNADAKSQLLKLIQNI